MAEIVIERVTKRFGRFTAVDALDIRFGDGEVTCLLGPSGCGKTTLMRMIAGLETPTEGRILFGGRDVTALPPRKRDIGMVFQYPVMYPTLSVAENIALPLVHDRSTGAAERARRVDEVLDVLDMRPLRDAFIDELDAGNRQKVAVGRAVARRSDIVLFDEPTTNVETNAKLQLIRAFKAVTRRLRQTIVYVTHDQTEAMTLADRIALMQAGRIVQYDRPAALYGHPTTEFGGWFLGNPGMNFVPAEIRDDGIVAALLARPLPATAVRPGGGPVRIGVRPEHVTLSAAPVADGVPGVLLDHAVGIAGRHVARIRIGEATVVKAKTSGPPPGRTGDTVHLTVAPDRIAVFQDGRRVA